MSDVYVPRIVLASRSERRREILTHLGLEPTVFVSEADETLSSGLPPEQYTEILSERKASAVYPHFTDNDLIIASDTVVYAGGEILGKPKDFEDAMRMLWLLSGSTHKVVSGLAVMYQGKTVIAHDSTEVTFRSCTEQELFAYVATGEPFDKAGAYGIQDRASVFIEKINGDYFTVVGLPVFRLFSLLKTEFDLDLFLLCGKSSYQNKSK